MEANISLRDAIKMLLHFIMEDLNSPFIALLLIYKLQAFYICSNKTFTAPKTLVFHQLLETQKIKTDKRLYIYEIHQ